MSNAAELLALLSLHLVLTALPLVAAMLAAAAAGVRRPSLLLCIGVAASGLVALTSFWAFYASLLAGRTYMYLVPLGSLLAIVACLRGGRIERALLRELATPLALWALGSVFLTYLGFLHGGGGAPLDMAALRFSGGQLPPDNVIPGWFADWFFHHSHHGTPTLFPGEWLFSDRPPLQVGYLLAEHGFGWSGNGMREQVIGVIVQQLWILGLWALLLAARVRRRARALVVIAVMLSNLVIVHGFYVWPKLLPAAFLLAAAALLLGPGWGELRRDRRAGLLFGALVSLALLGHGASVFGLVPLAVFALAAGLPGRRWLAAALAAGLLLVPWTAYQHFADPPGNRLSKWMLAGVEPIDERGTLETIADSYREAGVGGTLEHKWHNVGTIVGDPPAWERFENGVSDLGGGNWEGAATEFRWLFFFSLVPSLGLLLLGPAAMALARLRGRRRDGPAWRLAVLCWWAVLWGCVAWALLMFGTSQASASIHVGTLAIPLLALAACVLGLCAVLPRLAPWWVGLSALLTLAIYTPSLSPPEGSAYSLWAAAAALAAVAGFVAVAFRGSAESEEADFRAL